MKKIFYIFSILLVPFIGKAQSTAYAHIRVEVVSPIVITADTSKVRSKSFLPTKEGFNVVYKDTVWMDQKKTVKIINAE